MRGLHNSSSDALWLQYHPSFYAQSMLDWMGEALPKTQYARKIMTVHNPEGLKQRAFLNAFSDIVVHNESAKERLSPITRARLHVIPHFIYSREALAMQRPSATFRVATVGFAAENKRVPHLIDAFAIASALNPNMRLSILTSPFGTHSAHFEMSRIISKINRSSVTAAIDADLGSKSMPYLLGELSRAHLLCLPYAGTTESASGAARLGIAAGVPILRSKSSIFSDLPGGDITLQDDQAETLAEALLMLSQSPHLLDQKRAEIDAAYDKLNVDEIAKRLADVLF